MVPSNFILLLYYLVISLFMFILLFFCCIFAHTFICIELTILWSRFIFFILSSNFCFALDLAALHCEWLHHSICVCVSLLVLHVEYNVWLTICVLLWPFTGNQWRMAFWIILLSFPFSNFMTLPCTFPLIMSTTLHYFYFFFIYSCTFCYVYPCCRVVEIPEWDSIVFIFTVAVAISKS